MELRLNLCWGAGALAPCPAPTLPDELPARSCPSCLPWDGGQSSSKNSHNAIIAHACSCFLSQSQAIEVTAIPTSANGRLYLPNRSRMLGARHKPRWAGVQVGVAQHADHTDQAKQQIVPDELKYVFAQLVHHLLPAPGQAKLPRRRVPSKELPPAGRKGLSRRGVVTNTR